MMHCTLLGVASVAASLSFHSGTPRPEPPISTASARLAWADYDADGFADAIAFHPAGRVALFRNLGDGQFEDATGEAGLHGLAGLRQALWGDYDDDGLPDLFLLSVLGTGRLFQNRATSFVDVTDSAGLDVAAATHASWADYDGDGALDLVLQGTAGHRLYHNVGSSFEAVDLGVERLPNGVPGALSGTAVSELPGRVEARAESPALDGDTAAPGSMGGGGSPSGPAAGAGGTTTVTPGPPSLPMGFCASTIRDDASGSCVEASSIPALGMLYPLGTELNIEAGTGHVGIGTTNPSSLLDLANRIQLDVEAGTGSIVARNGFGIDTIHILAQEVAGNGAQIDLARFDGTDVIVMDAEVGTGGWPELSMRTTSGTETVEVISETSNGGARINLGDASGTTDIQLDAGASGGALVKSERIWATYNTNGLTIPTVEMYAGDTNAGNIDLRTSNVIDNVHIISEEVAGNGAQIDLGLFDGTPTIVLDAEVGSGGPELSMRTRDGLETVEIRAEEVVGNGAQIVLRKSDGTIGIILDAEQGGDGRITTEVLQITGGADLVESFDTGSEECVPGTVVVIDAERPGELRQSSSAYDSRVAGIVSGAGGIQPGLHLGQEGVASGDTPVALSGRVYVRCSAENGPIAPGDLLTTAELRGHAMRATDRERSFGAVIGKAMSSLSEETGLVLVLVSLQ